MGSIAHFSLSSPIPWFFPLTFLLPRPVFILGLYNKLPGWGLLLVFHSRHPRRGVPRLLSCSRAQFPLRNCTINFQGGLFCSLFRFLAHAMGFYAYFSAPTPSFRSGTIQLAFRMVLLPDFHSPYPYRGFFHFLYLSSNQNMRNSYSYILFL